MSERKKKLSRLSNGTPLKNTVKSRHSLANEISFNKNTKSSNNRQSIVKGEETNISVYVRCRSRNEREIKESSGVVVSTLGHLGKEVLLQTGPMSVSNKTYTFDRVFGAESDQEMVYEGIAKSVLNEMLQGYNCTIFAYGQTGTGKTYTMSGDIKNNNDRLSEEAGIIPRILMDLFKSLGDSSEHSVKVSFIELYNEELKDLLLINDQDEKKVRIFDDPNKKSIVVQGMEEIYIKDAKEGMKLLNDGSYKRQVAATQCNDLSSRSHSVFTITVHMKEIDPISGEEFLKIGKLNLVDLAGSENINRSGAENKRAREAGMINQSLLTLGRVINALVDQSSHIPYRESKLTRLLQDSLGGKTKTCIIATISPAKVSLDETISTLEYANRAKSIKNKPQVNQSMSKKLLIKEYVQEIEKLRNDLNATRNKNGIYLAEENWNQVTAESESRRIQVEEQKLRIQVLEDQTKKFKVDFEDYLSNVKFLENELNSANIEKSELSLQLSNKNEIILKTLKELDIEKLVNADHEVVKENLNLAYNNLLSLNNELNLNKDQLFRFIDFENSLHAKNSNQLNNSKTKLNSKIDAFKNDLDSFTSIECSKVSNDLDEKFKSYIEMQNLNNLKTAELFNNNSEQLESLIDNSINKFSCLINEHNSKINDIEKIKKEITNDIVSELNNLKRENSNFINEMKSTLSSLSTSSSSILQNINDNIQETFKTVENQFNTQSNEVLTLKSTLIEHELKYNNLLNQQITQINQFKVQEAKNSEINSNEILNKIAKLIKENEDKRINSINSSISKIEPELNLIFEKNNRFIKNFESFIDNKWIRNQNKFVDILNDESKKIHEQIMNKKSDELNSRISKIELSINKFNDEESKNFENLIINLDKIMEKLNLFSINLQSLNIENGKFNKNELNLIKNKSIEKINEFKAEFNSISKNLNSINGSTIKPHLTSINNLMNSVNLKFHECVEFINYDINEINYDFKNTEPLPKRQKLSVNSDDLNLKNKSRDEILSNLKDKDYSNFIKTPKQIKFDQEIKTPIPIPDKIKFKNSRPLSESSINLNVPKLKDQKLNNEKIEESTNLNFNK